MQAAGNRCKAADNRSDRMAGSVGDEAQSSLRWARGFFVFTSLQPHHRRCNEEESREGKAANTQAMVYLSHTSAICHDAAYPASRLAPVTQRVTLNVPYRDKDAAKTLGARWDAALRTWWATPEQCGIAADLLKWAGGQAPAPKPAPKTTANKGSRPVITERKLFSLAECNCRQVAPWDHCAHTDCADLEQDLDEGQRSHMEAISGRFTASKSADA